MILAISLSKRRRHGSLRLRLRKVTALFFRVNFRVKTTRTERGSGTRCSTRPWKKVFSFRKTTAPCRGFLPPSSSCVCEIVQRKSPRFSSASTVWKNMLLTGSSTRTGSCSCFSTPLPTSRVSYGAMSQRPCIPLRKILTLQGSGSCPGRTVCNFPLLCLMSKSSHVCARKGINKKSRFDSGYGSLKIAENDTGYLYLFHGAGLFNKRANANQVVPEHPGLPQILSVTLEKAENSSFPISPGLRLLHSAQQIFSYS